MVIRTKEVVQAEDRYMNKGGRASRRSLYEQRRSYKQKMVIRTKEVVQAEDGHAYSGFLTVVYHQAYRDTIYPKDFCRKFIAGKD